MREIRTSGSMRGCWRSSTVGLVRHRQTKGAGTARRDLPSGGQCSTLPYDAANAIVEARAIADRGEVPSLARPGSPGDTLNRATGLSDRIEA